MPVRVPTPVALASFHHDYPTHLLWMDGTVVRKGAGPIECVAIGAAGAQLIGVPQEVVRGHRMRVLALVGPYHACAGRHGDRGGLEVVIVDTELHGRDCGRR